MHRSVECMHSRVRRRGREIRDKRAVMVNDWLALRLL